MSTNRPETPPRRRIRQPSIAAQAFWMQVTILLVVAAASTAVIVWQQRTDGDRAARRQTTAIAVALATAPSTAAAITGPDPSAVLQPETQAIARRTGMDFIVVMKPDRTRFSHADPAKIGGRFTGNIDRALHGETFTEQYTGSLGPSIRAVTPVYDGAGRLVGLVSAGVTTERLGQRVAAALPRVIGIAALGLALAVLLSWLLERRLRRLTLGLPSGALRRLYEHHDAVLHTLTEGLLVFDADAPDGPAAVVNDEARRLLQLPDGDVAAADLPASLRGDADLTDELHVTTDRVLLVNRRPVTGPTGRIGTVLTVRDRTELQEVLGELDTARSLADTLSAQAHEHANRLHTVVTMIELGRGDAAVELATAELTASQELIDRLATTATPAVTALLVAKTAEAAAGDVEFTVAPDAHLTGGPLSTPELLTLIGNLVDNAFDAAGPDGWVELSAGTPGSGADSGAGSEADGADRAGWWLRVTDSGPGMTEEQFTRARARGYSTKERGDRAHGRGFGLALVDQLVGRHAGRITAERDPAAVLVRLPVTAPPVPSSAPPSGRMQR